MNAGELRKFKAALTRAQRAGDPARVLEVCAAFEAWCDVNGWPDYWNRFEIAARDARAEIDRSEW